MNENINMRLIDADELISRIENREAGRALIDRWGNAVGFTEIDRGCLLELIDNMAENSEQGQSIKRPCKVGDKIYTIDFPFITEDEIEQVRVTYEAYTKMIDKWKTIHEWEIGKYSFLTREEAEAALEKMKGE